MSNYLNQCNCGLEGCPYSWVLGKDYTKGIFLEKEN